MKLALVGPSFFGYLERLAQVFEERKISCVFFDERPSNSLLGKILLRVLPMTLKARITEARFKKIVKFLIDNEFTHVLLISPEAFPAWAVVELRRMGLRVCGYGWDSLKNKPHLGSLDQILDAVASFDPVDCNSRGYSLVPLYSDAFSSSVDAPTRETHVMCCATLHSQRPQWIVKMEDICKRRGWVYEFMLFYHARWLWLIRYSLWPHVWRLFSSISVRSFSRSELVAATRRSRVVLDLHHPHQSGLTMRTFEAISLGAMVLTTNSNANASVPEEISSRIFILQAEEAEKNLMAAISFVPKPLSTEALRFLTVDRFVDQLSFILQETGSTASSIR